MHVALVTAKEHFELRSGVRGYTVMGFDTEEAANKWHEKRNKAMRPSGTVLADLVLVKVTTLVEVL